MHCPSGLYSGFFENGVKSIKRHKRQGLIDLLKARKYEKFKGAEFH